MVRNNYLRTSQLISCAQCLYLQTNRLLIRHAWHTLTTNYRQLCTCIPNSALYHFFWDTVLFLIRKNNNNSEFIIVHIVSIERTTLQEYRWNIFQNNRIENKIELITIMWFWGFIFNSWPSILEDLWLLWLLRLKNSANKLALFLW